MGYFCIMKVNRNGPKYQRIHWTLAYLGQNSGTTMFLSVFPFFSFLFQFRVLTTRFHSVETMATRSKHSSSTKEKHEVEGKESALKGNKENKKGIIVQSYKVEGLSIAGHETCVIFPSLNLAFDIGRCPDRAISQDFLFISHAHMDHIVSALYYFLLLFRCSVFLVVLILFFSVFNLLKIKFIASFLVEQ